VLSPSRCSTGTAMFHFKVVEMQSIAAPIQFPHLNPVLFRLGPPAIHWYGIAYLLGFVVAYLLLLRLIRAGRLNIAPNDVGDLMSWLAIGVMVGGRAGWWFFYHRPSGSFEPWYEPVAIWHGGSVLRNMSTRQSLNWRRRICTPAQCTRRCSRIILAHAQNAAWRWSR
jgi:hypothetical protein